MSTARLQNVPLTLEVKMSITTKKCFKCSKIKPLSAFYKHNEMTDGHLGKCKECTKKDVMKHREDNLEKVREYDRNRPNAKERVKRNYNRIKRYREDGDKRYDSVLEKGRRWGRENRDKTNAHTTARRGLTNPNQCERCSSTKSIQGHHPDYTKPLEVIWLCPSCHGAEHKRINNLRRARKL